MTKRLSAWVIAVVLLAGPAAVQARGQDNPVNITVTRDGGPAAGVPIDLHLVNRGKIQAGTTGPQGELSMVMSIANLGKPTRLQVVIYDCPADQMMVVLVEAGATAPENRDCKRRVAGWFWFGRARAVVIDATRGTLQVRGGQSFLASRNGRLIAGGGAALVGVGLLAAGGGDSSNTSTGSQSPAGQSSNTTFDPNGNYGVTNSVASDPGEHRFFIQMENNTVLTLTITGSTVRITCPPGSKWTLLTGTFNASTGQITAEGRGPAAGFSNVLFRFAATIAMSGSNRGAMTGTLTIGPNGELNGGPPITYNVAGTKQ